MTSSPFRMGHIYPSASQKPTEAAVPAQPYSIGQKVEKFGGDYTGPGVVRDYLRYVSEDGVTRVRYIVAHRIEGGTGELLHIYSPQQLRAKE